MSGKPMSTVTFIIGLCGSGKSWLLDQLKYEYPEAVTFESLIGNRTEGFLLQCLREGKDCIVEEITFCHPVARDKIVRFLSQVPGVKIIWMAFDNDLESANWNVKNRTNKGDPEGHLCINQRVHKDYEPPEGVKTIPIKRIDPCPADSPGSFASLNN
jgi:hypothetical protein